MTKYNGPIKEVKVMEKMKVKQEVATAIECVKSDTHWSLDSFLDSHAKNENAGGHEWWMHEYHPLNKLSVSELAKAFFVGYEIEPEQPKFEAGDKVVYGKEIVTLVERDYRHHEYGYGRAWKLKEFAGWLGEKQFHKATPEEIYWLEELGRDKVGDFRERDVVRTEYQMLQVFKNMGCQIYNNHVSPEHAKELYEKGELYWLMPADSFRPFPKEPSNGNH